jgi:hypothetical protein|tara:strand:+ start:8098 stop:10098 length:2001 start_codon:yes stop_codon:yes gene_type:complete
MPKVVVTENLKDAALVSSGVGHVVAETGYGTQRIEAPVSVKKYNVEFLESEIKHDEGFQYEVAKIKVSPIITMSNFFSSVRADFSSGQKSNHYFKMPEMVDLGETHTENYSTSKSQGSYSFETIFNYISEEYDKLQVGISEYNLYAPFDKASKQDFLNIRDRNTEIINFSRGNQMRNLVVPTMKVDQGSDETPYYNYLRINQRLDNGISHFAIKLGIFDELLQDYLFGRRTSISFDIQTGREVSQDSSMSIYNLESFLTSDTDLDLDNFFTLNRSIQPSRMSLDLRKHLMKGFLKETSKTGFRTYEDIHNNIESHKEVFCYSVDKYAATVQDSTKIQTLYAPALRESTPVIDTQVKYGKHYAYKVTGHYMIVGNNYEYRQVMSSNDPEDTYSIIEVTNRPSVVIIPFHIFSKQINIVQMPPVYPQVSFKTENDSSKSISMYLSPTKTEVIAPFIKITPDDDIQLRELERLPNIREPDGKFRFKTYGDQGLFEVFRLDSPPSSFSDFKNAKIGEVSMPFKTMSGIFKDVVIPNKKYYYLFRSINQKGLVSNPTSIYEATLLIDADDSQVITDVYHFPKPRDMESALGFRKLLRVTPAVEHILFDAAQDALFGKRTLVGTLDDLKLGIRDKAVWGRKFKIRIKSKTSGKMIDIILNVDLTKNKTEEEF